MSFFDLINQENIWHLYLDHEQNKVVTDGRIIRSVNSIINKQKYLKFNKDYFNKWPIPEFIKIPKFNTKKTRDVFVYPYQHNIVLKVLAFYILLNYNHKFEDNSLAYTWGKGVKTAFKKVEKFNITREDIIYKNDFKDYFNQVNLDILKPKLLEFFNDKDKDIVDFIMNILSNPEVKYKNNIIRMDTKGVMAGSPISGILANIYMHEVDGLMYKNKFKYIRYADDTLIVADEALNFFKEELKKLDINFNPKKEEIFNLSTGITFLGFTYKDDIVDLSYEAKAKMKSRMKRRAKWYRVWSVRNNVPKEIVLRHYIKGINEKLYTDFADSINWSRWYLPSINTTESIKFLDDYFIQCIRYLDSGTWTRGKKYYRLSYEDIKNFGYQSLVNNYYRVKQGKPFTVDPFPEWFKEQKRLERALRKANI